MALEILILLLIDGLDDHGPPNRPNHVQIAWMDNHAVFVGEVEAHAGTDT